MDRGKIIELWRPVSAEELRAIKELDSAAFVPPAGVRQRYLTFTTRGHAIELARDWLVPIYGEGFVVRCVVCARLLDHLVHDHVVTRSDMDYWIPLKGLEAFHATLIGKIEVVYQHPE
ncbi:hypothetical protein [Novosphingobium sp. MBES04]|uniref:hypothetical protein n=1 Tax=Novosphingobium sp. MBES04 TaxID=1206458 RepID=UPI000693852B|nr:hypothetical protein [Novosphingobium sp. MBES04]